MNLSKEMTAKWIEDIISAIKWREMLGDENEVLRMEAVLKCLQHHLKSLLK